MASHKHPAVASCLYLKTQVNAPQKIPYHRTNCRWGLETGVLVAYSRGVFFAVGCDWGIIISTRKPDARRCRRTRTIRTATSSSTTPRGGATPLPRRAQPLLLLFRSNPPTEWGGGPEASAAFLVAFHHLSATDGSTVSIYWRLATTRCHNDGTQRKYSEGKNVLYLLQSRPLLRFPLWRIARNMRCFTLQLSRTALGPASLRQSAQLLPPHSPWAKW